MALHERLSAYYEFILKHPPAFVNYSAEALESLANRAKSPMTPDQISASMQMAGPLSCIGYGTVCPTTFVFPKDYGPHYDLRTEWYYLACTFKVDGAPDISFVTSVVRKAVVPECFQDPSNALTKDYDIVDVVAAFTIPSENFHSNYTSTVFGTDASVSFQASPFVWNGDIIQLESTSSTADVFPLSCRVDDKENDIQLNITMQVSQNPGFFLEGDQGCAPCLSSVGTLYYSWPLITCEGTLTKEGETFAILPTSTGWLDHQYLSRFQPLGFPSSTFLRLASNLSSTPQRIRPRWVWFFGQLTDGTAFTTSRIPAPEAEVGEVVELTNTTYVEFDLSTETDRGSGKAGTVTFTGTFASPTTGTIYPHGWTMSLPRWNMQITLTPTLANQIIGTSGDELWEGGVMITGTKDGAPISGSGFAEMNAYVSEELLVQSETAKLGIEDNDEFLPKAGMQGLSWFLILLPIVLTVVLLALVVTSSVFIARKKRVGLPYVVSVFALAGGGLISSVVLAEI